MPYLKERDGYVCPHCQSDQMGMICPDCGGFICCCEPCPCEVLKDAKKNRVRHALSPHLDEEDES
jgi:hypothetical protein